MNSERATPRDEDEVEKDLDGQTAPSQVEQRMIYPKKANVASPSPQVRLHAQYTAIIASILQMEAISSSTLGIPSFPRSPACSCFQQEQETEPFMLRFGQDCAVGWPQIRHRGRDIHLL